MLEQTAWLCIVVMVLAGISVVRIAKEPGTRCWEASAWWCSATSS